MNHTIKITVGMCSVESQGDRQWSDIEIEAVVEALTKASIANGEKNCMVEMAIGNSGDLASMASEKIRGQVKDAIVLDDEAGFDEDGFKLVKIHKSAYLATSPSKDINPPINTDGTHDSS